MKESISKQLSIEMIHMLELIIFFSCFGEIQMSVAFYDSYSLFDIVMLVISIVYIFLPMESISEMLFPLDNIEEVCLRSLLLLNSLLLMKKDH